MGLGGVCVLIWMIQGVLYLMIVNLPTQEEVTTAQQALYELA